MPIRAYKSVVLQVLPCSNTASVEQGMVIHSQPGFGANRFVWAARRGRCNTATNSWVQPQWGPPQKRQRSHAAGCPPHPPIQRYDISCHQVLAHCEARGVNHEPPLPPDCPAILTNSNSKTRARAHGGGARTHAAAHTCRLVCACKPRHGIPLC